MWGTATVYDSDPPVDREKDVYYLPWTPDGVWGLFNKHDRPVWPAVDFRLPTHELHGQRLVSYTTHTRVIEAAPRDAYVYGGRFHPHFGHFLVECLPRYWTLADGGGPRSLLRPRGPKFVLHSTASADFFSGFPFARQIFSALGLTGDNFIFFDRPVRIPEIMVPSVSLQQQAFASRAFARLCHAVGRGLLGGLTPIRDDRPVWLSKSRLAGGVRRYADELEMEAIFKREGVEIVYPETLSLADQVALFMSRPRILGTLGSAFHVSIFAPPGSRMIMLSSGPVLNSNYMLLDNLNNNKAEYWYAPGTTEAPGERFMLDVKLPDPVATAHALLELI